MISQAMFIAALRKGNPDIDTKQASSIWNEVSSKTDLSALSPQQGAQLAYKLAEHSCKSTRHYAMGTPPGGAKPLDEEVAMADISKYADTPLSMPANVEVQTQLKNPYAGTPQMAANPENPEAASMAAFDPAAREAARQQYLRMVASMPAATMGTGGSPELLKQHDEFLRNISTEHQKGLETQATAGEAAATSMQTRFKQAGEYTATQAEKQIKLANDRADLIVKNLGTEQQQRMNKPDSNETTLAKSLILTQIKNNPSMSPEGRKELSEMLKTGNVTAQQLLPAMAKWVPEAHKSYLDQVTANKDIVTTGGVQQSQKLVENKTGVGPGTGVPVGAPQPAGQSTPQATAAPTSQKVDPVTGLPTGTNNVGNLKDMKTGEFRTFKSPVEGRIALQEDLLAKSKKGFNTVESIISRYAPKSDNNPTEAYIANVSKALGVDPKAQLDLSNPNVMKVMTDAMIKQEGNTKIVNPTAQQAPLSTESQQAAARTQRQTGNANIITEYLKGQTAPAVPKAPGAGWDEALYGKKAKAAPYAITGMSTTSGASVGESGVAEQRRKDADTDINTTDNLVNAYTNVKPSVNYAFDNAAIASRARGMEANARNNDPEFKKLEQSVAVLNQTAAELGITKPTGPGGNAVKAIGGALQSVPNVAAMAAGSTINAVGGGLSKDTVSATSTEAEIKDMATRVAIAKAQNEKLRDYKREFAENNTDYSLQGFTGTPIFKQVTDMSTYIPLINSKNPSEVVLVHKGDTAQLKKYKDENFMPARKYLIQ